MDNNWDFKGWATYYDILCADNRIIEKGCFDRQDGQSIPLLASGASFYNPEDVIGHVILETKEEGVYCYGYFSKDINTPQIENTKMMLHEGILKNLGIYANKLKEKKGEDEHIHTNYGVIRTVSMCSSKSSANPKARIEVIQV